MNNDHSRGADAGQLEEPGGRPIPGHPDALLFTAEAAFLLGLSRRTLEALRLRGGGPAYYLVGRRACRYKRSDLTAWLDSRRRKNTSDPGPDEAGAGS